MNAMIAIAAGGAIGAVLRYLADAGMTKIAAAGFPWGIFAVNVAGSFLMGLCAAFFTQNASISESLRLFATAGLLGGFTTFSSFSLDAFNLLARGQYGAAAVYIGGSVFFSILALAAGWQIARAVTG